jgi:hypothetical protein
MTTSFTALPSGVDAATAELIIAMPLTSDDEVIHWFGLVQDAHHAEQEDLERFTALLQETAGSMDSAGLTQFCETL